MGVMDDRHEREQREQLKADLATARRERDEFKAALGEMRKAIAETNCFDPFCTEHGSREHLTEPHTNRCRFADLLATVRGK